MFPDSPSSSLLDPKTTRLINQSDDSAAPLESHRDLFSPVSLLLLGFPRLPVDQTHFTPGFLPGVVEAHQAGHGFIRQLQTHRNTNILNKNQILTFSSF